MGVERVFLESENIKFFSQLPWLKSLLLLIKDLRYGSVTLVVQDGKVIQIERIEKIRLC